MIEFLGRVVGKALYEGILLDYSFSHVFVQKLLGRYSFLDELSTLDPEVYRNLMYVKVNLIFACLFFFFFLGSLFLITSLLKCYVFILIIMQRCWTVVKC